MSVCEVPLLSGLPRLIDIQTSEPTAWRVASDHVSIQTNTRLASSQLNPVLRAFSNTGRSWPSATDLNLDNDRDNRVAAQRCVVSGADDKIGVSQSSAERCFRKRKPRLRFIALLYSHYPFRAVLPSCLLYTSPSPRDQRGSRMPSSA